MDENAIYYQFTQKKLIELARVFVDESYSLNADAGTSDVYYARLGMLIDFITEIAP